MHKSNYPLFSNYFVIKLKDTYNKVQYMLEKKSVILELKSEGICSYVISRKIFFMQ